VFRTFICREQMKSAQGSFERILHTGTRHFFRPAGVILTGGRSRRMGGGFKAMALLNEKPLIRHVIDRLQPQVQTLVLSVEKYSPEFGVFDLQQVEDPRPGSRGPLGGLLSALAHLESSCDWILLVPCDAPFLPLDLASRLMECALDGGQAGCVVRYDSEIQPTFSIWHRRLLPQLEKAVLEKDMAGFKQFLRDTPVAILEWEPSDPSPFFNINDPDSLIEAARLLDLISVPI
jgi:molybdopterin-guanine dinucleotide biosynthesis protein A